MIKRTLAATAVAALALLAGAAHAGGYWSAKADDLTGEHQGTGWCDAGACLVQLRSGQIGAVLAPSHGITDCGKRGEAVRYVYTRANGTTSPVHTVSSIENKLSRGCWVDLPAAHVADAVVMRFEIPRFGRPGEIVTLALRAPFTLDRFRAYQKRAPTSDELRMQHLEID